MTVRASCEQGCVCGERENVFLHFLSPQVQNVCQICILRWTTIWQCKVTSAMHFIILYSCICICMSSVEVSLNPSAWLPPAGRRPGTSPPPRDDSSFAIGAGSSGLVGSSEKMGRAVRGRCSGVQQRTPIMGPMRALCLPPFSFPESILPS